MKNIKNFRSFELFEAASFFKPLSKVNLAEPTPAQEKKVEAFSDQKKIDFDKFMNDGAKMEVVIDAPGFKAGDLYDGMRSWLFKYYEDPKKSEGRWDKSINKGVIRGMFTVKTFFYYKDRCDVSYSLDFLFKDDKFKVVYSNIESQYFDDRGIPKDDLTFLSFKLSDPVRIKMTQNYIQNPQGEEEKAKPAPKPSNPLVLPAMDSPFSSDDDEDKKKPEISPSVYSLKIYDSAYNNGAAIFLSVQEYTTQMKPGSLGSEFNF
jgi:hypothetical protein